MLLVESKFSRLKLVPLFPTNLNSDLSFSFSGYQLVLEYLNVPVILPIGRGRRMYSWLFLGINRNLNLPHRLTFHQRLSLFYVHIQKAAQILILKKGAPGNAVMGSYIMRIDLMFSFSRSLSIRLFFLVISFSNFTNSLYL